VKLRDRVLTDKGFVNTGSKEKTPDRELIAMLRGKVEKLERKLADKDKLTEGQRDMDMNKMVEKVANLEKENRKLKQDNDKLKSAGDKMKAMDKEMKDLKEENSKLKGREVQLLKEIKDVQKVVEPKKK